MTIIQIFNNENNGKKMNFIKELEQLIEYIESQQNNEVNFQCFKDLIQNKDIELSIAIQSMGVQQDLKKTAYYTKISADSQMPSL